MLVMTLLPPLNKTYKTSKEAAKDWNRGVSFYYPNVKKYIKINEVSPKTIVLILDNNHCFRVQ